MPVLFETYFTDTIDFSREMYQRLLEPYDFFPSEDEVNVIVSSDPEITVRFLRTPVEGHHKTYAGMQRITKGKRSTITLKSGKKARRVLVEGGELFFNVANIIMKFRNMFPDFYKFKHFINKTKEGGYEISENLGPSYFFALIKRLINTNFFAHIFAHEIQHFYNPWVHKRAESHRKVKTKEKLTRDEQRDLNYILSNAEVDSRTIESAARVIGEPTLVDIFDENTPANLRRFIKASIANLVHDGSWEYYPEHIRRRVVKRFSQIFYHEMQKRSRGRK